MVIVNNQQKGNAEKQNKQKTVSWNDGWYIIKGNTKNYLTWIRFQTLCVCVYMPLALNSNLVLENGLWVWELWSKTLAQTLTVGLLCIKRSANSARLWFYFINFVLGLIWLTLQPWTCRICFGERHGTGYCLAYQVPYWVRLCLAEAGSAVLWRGWNHEIIYLYRQWCSRHRHLGKKEGCD